MKNVTVLHQQHGSADLFNQEELLELDGPADERLTENIISMYQKCRSYVLLSITQEQYINITKKIYELRMGTDCNDPRTGGLKIALFKPGEDIVIDDDLLITHDYKYTSQTICYSDYFTQDVIDTYNYQSSYNGDKSILTYRLFGIDMIWCRENTLFERLEEVLNNEEDNITSNPIEKDTTKYTLSSFGTYMNKFKNILY